MLQPTAPLADGPIPLRLDEQPDYWLTPDRLPTRPVEATIIVPTFCAEATLERALRSALGQTLDNIELLVVDDASTDGSWDLIATLIAEDPRVRSIRNKKNCGKPVGMNRAMACAKGRWLAVLDADDWYHPDRLKTLIAIGEDRSADMVGDNQFFFDAIANTIVGTAWKPGAADWGLTFDGFLEGSNAYSTFSLGMLKPVMRTSFVRRAGLSYEEQARNGQDFFHLLQFYLSGGQAVISDTPFYYYTQPFGAISRRWSHAARKRYDFQTAYIINQRKAEAARDVLTPSQAGRLAGRNRQLLALEQYYQAKQLLFERSYWQALVRLATRPATLRYAAWRLRHRLFENADSWAIERVASRARKTGRPAPSAPSSTPG